MKCKIERNIFFEFYRNDFLFLMFNFRYCFVAKPIEDVITANLEKVPRTNAIGFNMPINEDWFNKKVNVTFLNLFQHFESFLYFILFYSIFVCSLSTC